VDGASKTPRPGMHVLVEGGRIREVSDRPLKLATARVVSLNGRTLMPGLIDCHVHVLGTTPGSGPQAMLPGSLVLARSLQIMRGMLMRGFTTVRDAAGADHGLKVAIEEGLIVAPNIIICGKALSQTNGHGDTRGRYDDRDPSFFLTRMGAFSRICDGVEEVRAAAREEIKGGAEFIKIMGNGGVASPTDPISSLQFSREEIRAIVEEARNAQTYVAAHLYTDESIRRAVECGVHSIEHANLVSEDTANLMRQRGSVACPTLVAFETYLIEGHKHGLSALARAKTEEVMANGLRSLEILRAAGITMGYGSDLGGWMHPFQSEEFLIRSRVLPVHEVIRAATLDAAKLLGKEGEIGCIQPGARADLIAVDGNPLVDISLLTEQGRHLCAIMIGGNFAKNEIN
jgi:imidazolonepropionase-like amidohydrolase